MPIFDQEGARICYAYAAAQLFNFEKIKDQKKSQQVSPLSAAVAEAYSDIWADKPWGDQDLNGGNAYSALNAINGSGYCTEENTQKILSAFKSPPHPLTDAEIIMFLTQKPNEVECADKDPSSILAFVGHQANTFKLFQELFRSCQKTVAPVTGFRELESKSPSDFVIKTNDSLSNHPVLINFCGNELFQNLPPKKRRYSEKKCRGHSALITAQRKSKNKCQVLIRNSWGPAWMGPRGTSCACYTESNEYESVCLDPSQAREIVGCWFDRETIFNLTKSIVFRISPIDGSP
jgi:hypothetical protein